MNLTQASALLRPRVAALIVVALVAVYLLVLHPWLMNWGATPAEQALVLTGDERVAEPATQFTRAITIHAPVSRVWPWLLQIGQDRAGFYSNDWLENIFLANIHNGDELRPEWQTRALGDGVLMTRPDYLGGRLGDATKTWIRVLEPGRVIGDTPGRFVLQPLDDGTTRLLLRERDPVIYKTPVEQTVVPWLMRLTWDPMHFVMEKRMLMGIRARAEGQLPRSPAMDIVAHLGWLLAAAGLAGLFLARRAWQLWLILLLLPVGPILVKTHDVDAALAAFMAVGITVLGALVWGRRWLAPYAVLAAGVLLGLLLAPDAYVAFGVAFLVLVVAGAWWALSQRRRLTLAWRA